MANLKLRRESIETFRPGFDISVRVLFKEFGAARSADCISSFDPFKELFSKNLELHMKMIYLVDSTTLI
jgi:hypothetical protein